MVCVIIIIIIIIASLSYSCFNAAVTMMNMVEEEMDKLMDTPDNVISVQPVDSRTRKRHLVVRQTTSSLCNM